MGLFDWLTGTKRPQAGVAPKSAAEVRAALLAVNRPTAPFIVRDGAPEQVEAIVTRPVETALSGVSDLENVRSESIQGLSVVTAVFKEGTDIYRARQMLAEKLTTIAGELPPGVKSPKMSPLTSSSLSGMPSPSVS